jgi:hypothetical protein
MRAVLSAGLYAATVLAVAAATAGAQGNYEIQVYGAETVAPKTLMIELHSNFTFTGQYFPNGMAPTNHAEHETLELTMGVTEWSELGFYVFTSEQNGLGAQWVGDHIRPRIRIPESWKWPVGLSLSTEVGYQRALFSPDTWTWEIRPIIDKSMGPWYVALNPALERSWHGPSVSEGVEFAPNVKVNYDFTEQVSGGLEYYGSTGSLRELAPAREQQHQFFGAVDLNVSPDWEINFGVGVGTTPTTDHLMAKLILGRRISWGEKKETK